MPGRTFVATMLAAILLALLLNGCYKLSNSAIAGQKSLISSDRDSQTMSVQNHQLLSQALATNKMDQFKTYLDERPDLANKKFAGITIMFDACFFDRKPAVQYLIDKGADVNAVSGTGEKPLDRAASSKADDVVALLKAHGAVYGNTK